jgi:hypothetical protein
MCWFKIDSGKSVSMSVEIILLPSLQNKLADRRYGSHKAVILMLKRKLGRLGISALKILAVEGNYVIAELKAHRPPYRLYVAYDQQHSVFYLVEWEHKSKQDEIISKIKGKLALAGEYTMDE